MKKYLKCLIFIVIITFIIIICINNILSKKIYATISLEESQYGYTICMDDNEYTNLPINYFVHEKYESNPIAILKYNSYILSNIYKKYVYYFPNDKDHNYIYVDFFDMLIKDGLHVKKDYVIPAVSANNIKAINIYSENDELVYVIDKSKQIEKILNQYKYDSDDPFYVNEYDAKHETYDVCLLFNDGLLNYSFGYISAETLKSWKAL